MYVYIYIYIYTHIATRSGRHAQEYACRVAFAADAGQTPVLDNTMAYCGLTHNSMYLDYAYIYIYIHVYIYIYMCYKNNTNNNNVYTCECIDTYI